MSEDEVILAMGEEPTRKESTGDGRNVWLYQRSKGFLTVIFGLNGRVESYTTPGQQVSKKTQARRKAGTTAKASNDYERMEGIEP
jgi:hypothetical protein